MAKPIITTNFSDVTQLEGLYILELTPPTAIGGVSLNTIGFVGETVRGPVNVPVEISSPARFLDVFGGKNHDGSTTTENKVWLSTINKKMGPFQVVRVASSTAAAATATSTDGYLTVTASSAGVWGNAVTFQVLAASDAVTTHFNLAITDYTGRVTTYQNLDIAGSDNNLLAVVGDDAANPVILTKAGSGRPVNQGPTALAGGTSPSVVDADWTATGGVLETAANADGISIVCPANHTSSAIKDKLLSLAGESSDRVFLDCPDSETVSLSTFITEAATRRHERLIHCFNHTKTLDPQSAVKVWVQPTDAMALVLSRTDVDIHPGDPDTQAMLTYITDLAFPALGRGDYIAARQAGISALEKDGDGFDFLSGVTSSLTPGKEQITRRRMADFLNLSLANSTLRYMVKKKDTKSRRATISGLIKDFLGGLEKAERVVEDFSVDGEILNTPDARSEGIEQVLVKVKLINHILELVLQVEAGTNVTIKEAQ